MKRILVLTSLLAAGLLTGCLERKEKITVKPNGAVEIALAYKGDPGDFEGGDALPTKEVGWDVSDERVQKAEGDEREELLRTAVRRFAPGAELPETFAVEDARDQAVSLRFPTSLEIERRSDGTYYHFKRVYPAREHARFEYYKEQAAERYGKVEDILGEREFADLSGEEQGKILSSLRYVELHRHIDDVYDAAAGMDWTQDVLLKLDRELNQYFDRTSVEPMIAALREPQSPARDERINRIAEEFVDGAREHVGATLEDLRIPAAEVDAFFEAFDTAEQMRAVTEDLGDEHWNIELSLPGEVVAHNATKVEDGKLVWEFPAAAFFDRDQILMATSRVSRDKRPESQLQQQEPEQP